MLWNWSWGAVRVDPRAGARLWDAEAAGGGEARGTRTLGDGGA